MSNRILFNESPQVQDLLEKEIPRLRLLAKLLHYDLLSRDLNHLSWQLQWYLSRPRPIINIPLEGTILETLSPKEQ